MTKRMPPVPEEQRCHKGPGSDPKMAGNERDHPREESDQRGERANIRQNTRNQGYQQDR
jgi:hypothetical protein